MTNEDLLFLLIKYPKLANTKFGEFLAALPMDFLIEYQYKFPVYRINGFWNTKKAWNYETIYEELYQYETRTRHA